MITTFKEYPFCLGRPHRAALIRGQSGVRLSAEKRADGNYY